MRRVSLIALAIVVAAGCVWLGLWQLDRLRERRAGNDRIRSGLEGQPVTLEAAPSVGLDYRRASATGTYDGANSVLLYGRPLGGRPGDHVLTPLRLEDGSAILVDRGWVPTGQDAPVPTGSLSVRGVLLPSESMEGVAPADGRVKTVDLEGIATALPYRLAPLYLLAQQEEPSRPGLPVPAPLPELSEGPHLSYAIQWFSFAAVALVGCAVLLRRGGAHAEGRTE